MGRPWVPHPGRKKPNHLSLGEAIGQTDRDKCGLIPPCSFPIFSPEPPKISLTPAPLVWAAPGEAPPELLCLVSRFYPAKGLEVEWELRGGPEGSFQKAEGQSWLSALRHHSDGSVSLSAHLQPIPVTAKHHGARYACRVHHPTLPTLGRSAEVTLEVAGRSQKGNRAARGGVVGVQGFRRILQSLLFPTSTCQDSLGPPWRTAWASSCLPFSSSGSSKRWAGWVSVTLIATVTVPAYSQKPDTYHSTLPHLHPNPS